MKTNSAAINLQDNTEPASFEVSTARQPVIEDLELARLRKKSKKIATAIKRKEREIGKFRADAERFQKAAEKVFSDFAAKVRPNVEKLLSLLGEYRSLPHHAPEPLYMLCRFITDLEDLSHGALQIQFPEWFDQELTEANQEVEQDDDDDSEDLFDSFFKPEESEQIEGLDPFEEFCRQQENNRKEQQKLWSKSGRDVPQEDKRSLRELYVRLARQCHPDTAPNEEARLAQEQIMKRVTAAFAEGNLFGLLEIEKELAAKEIGAASLARFSYKLDEIQSATQQLTMMNEHLARLQKEHRALKISDLGQLTKQELYREKRGQKFGMPEQATMHKAEVILAEGISKLQSVQTGKKAIKRFSSWATEIFGPQEILQDIGFLPPDAMEEIIAAMMRRHQRRS